MDGRFFLPVDGFLAFFPSLPDFSKKAPQQLDVQTEQQLNAKGGHRGCLPRKEGSATLQKASGELQSSKGKSIIKGRKNKQKVQKYKNRDVRTPPALHRA